MKVICIDAKNGVPLGIEEGEIYTVTRVETEIFNVVAYFLLGFPQDQPFCFDRFIPVSDVDETEFNRAYIKEIIS